MNENALAIINMVDVKSLSQEQRLEKFFEIMKLPSGQIPYMDRLYEMLHITAADILRYQKQKEKEVSLTPAKKRDVVIKEVVKPLMKAAGFKWIKGTWYKKLNSGILFVHLRNDRFNSIATGANFWFEVSASKYDEIRENLENQWIYNQYSELLENDFLPYWGFLMPYHHSHGYQIDGYQNYLPRDQPIEDIMVQISDDFKRYIIPAISKIDSMEAWYILYEEKMKHKEDKEFRLLSYYIGASLCIPMKENFKSMSLQQSMLNLTEEDICSHFEWLDLIMVKSASPQEDLKQFILKALQFRQETANSSGRGE